MTTPGRTTGVARECDVCAAACPSREALDRIAGRWTTLSIRQLAAGPSRFGELRRAI